MIQLPLIYHFNNYLLKNKLIQITLKDKYDKKEIELKNISLSDLNLLIQAYNEETTKLKLDTQRILKNSQNNS